MELYTLDRDFKKLDVVDEFESAIWTERFYGDGDFELVFPNNSKLIQKFPLDIFLSEAESDEVMILETRNVEEDKMKMNGISLLPWMNNRFLSAAGASWPIVDEFPGIALWNMIYAMVGEDSTSLDSLGIDDFIDRIKIPELGLHSADASGDTVKVEIPFGPLYDAMKNLATEYQVGMKIVLESLFSEKVLGFKSYKGRDLTTGNPEGNSVVRLSSDSATLSDIRELHSTATYKNLALSASATSGDDAASAWLDGTAELSGFDLRVLWLDAGLANSKVSEELSNYPSVKVIDGQLLSTRECHFGVNYNLGDLVEIQGDSGLISVGRITEHIHSQDSTGEKAWENKDILQ